MFCLSNICYLCLTFHKNIVSQNNETLKWMKKLQYFIPDYILQKSDVPKYICDHCIENIEKINEFREKCLGNINIFDEHIQKLTQVPGSYQCLSVMLTDILPNEKSEMLFDIHNDIGSLNEESIYDFKIKSNILGADDSILSSENQPEEMFTGSRINNTQITYDNTMVKINSKKENKKKLITTDIEKISKSSTENRTEKIMKNNMNMEQISISYDNILTDTEIIEPVVTKNHESTFKEPKCNLLIHGTYETDNLTLPKTEDVASGNIENHRQVLSKYEDEQEPISIKNEITEGLIIKGESDFIQTEIQEHTVSEKFSNSNLYYSIEDEATGGPCAVNKYEISENIGKLVPFEVEKGLEDKSLKIEFSEELIINDEPDFIQIETQKNTDSEQFPDGNLHFSTEAESIAVLHKNSICEFQSELIHADFKPYECDVGKKNMHKKSVLKQYQRIHSDEYLHACDICKKTFSDKSSLVQHHRVIHTGKRSYACNICKKTSSRKDDFLKHERIHTGEKPYACDVCKKTFNVKSNLIRHKIIHTSERPYECIICKKAFRRKTDFERHERIHTGEKPYACDVCEKTFSDRCNLITHKIIHTGERPYACNICKRTFSRKSDFQKHERIHTGKKPYACDVCEKTFYSESILTAHKIIHARKRPYACNICKKTLGHKSCFHEHERIHTGENIEKMYSFKVEKEFEDICVKKGITEELIIKNEPDFIQIETQKYSDSEEVPGGNLYLSTEAESIARPNKNSICESERNLTYTGIKPYECDVSIKEIYQQSVLKQYEPIHTDENSHACDVCKRTFIDKSSLDEHKIINTCVRLYACNICKKSFRCKSAFQRHERVHTGEKPYACDVCEKSFSDKSVLVRHKIIHTDKRPYACNICKKTFNRKNNLSQHERIHTG